MAQPGKPPEQYEIEDFVTDESFINYFFHLDAEDVSFWEKWLLTNPARKESVDAAKEMLRSLTLTLSTREISDETEKLKTAIGFETTSALSKTTSALSKTPAIVRFLPFIRAKRLVKVAALVILLAAGYFVDRFVIHPDSVIEKFNRDTHPIVFSLPDGTTVTLAPLSVLRYASGFGDKERTVSLNGEAQFDVSRKTEHPFEVRENEIKVTVLGTIFSVKAPSGDSVTVVELIKGRLKVENINSTGVPLTSIILNPDERVIYNRHDKRLYKERWQPQQDLPLQVGHILFQRNNFDEIAAKIKAVFGITVINQSKKRNWMFSGEFENATAEEIIRNICVVERLNFQTTGDTIFIK
jgi:ferric-dicitrate binding protein FerR (iron transport regulator)